MARYTRRRFLEESLIAAAAASVPASSLFAAEKKAKAKKGSTSPNEKIGIALVAAGGRASDHIGAWTGRNDTEILYVVDPDEKLGQQKAEGIAKKQGRAPKVIKDMRQAFEDSAVDVVSTATPNHWHSLVAIWAMQAGKDVYVEKPVSHNVSEGRRAVQVARKYKKICQAGTQCRSMAGTVEAIEYVKSGKIGEVKLAYGLCYKRRGSIGARGEYPIPAGIDYSLWSGPAPLLPLTRPKLHYDWHWQWPYGNGDLGNQGIHQMDIARWGLGKPGLAKRTMSYGGRFGYEDAGDTANTQMVLHEYDDATLVFEVRGLPTDSFKGASVGVVFSGSDGYVVLTSYTSGAAFDKNGNKVKDFNGDGDHYDNFIKACRSRKCEDLNADILEGHLSSALCHMGNTSYRLGEKLPASEVKKRLAERSSNDKLVESFERFTGHLEKNKVAMDSIQIQYGADLTMDVETETWINNPKACEMLTREYRAPFVVPTADKI